MADGRQLEKAKNVVLMDIINRLLKTGNKTTNINAKNCSLYTLLTATYQKPQKIINKLMLTILTLTFRLC